MAEHATTGDAINHAIDKASEGLSQITHALSNAAPQAWGLLVKATYAQGLISIIIGGIELAAGGLLFLTACWLAKTDWKESPSLRNCGSVGCFLLTAIMVIAALFDLLNSDSWFRVISPDGYLAQQFMNKAL